MHGTEDLYLTLAAAKLSLFNCKHLLEFRHMEMSRTMSLLSQQNQAERTRLWSRMENTGHGGLANEHHLIDVRPLKVSWVYIRFPVFANYPCLQLHLQRSSCVQFGQHEFPLMGVSLPYLSLFTNHVHSWLGGLSLLSFKIICNVGTLMRPELRALCCDVSRPNTFLKNIYSS